MGTGRTPAGPSPARSALSTARGATPGGPCPAPAGRRQGREGRGASSGPGRRGSERGWSPAGRAAGKLDGWVRTGSPEEDTIAEDCNISKEMKELQKQWHSVMQIIHSNTNVVAFMNSRVGQYLDDHPFVALSLLVFIAVSAIPVAFFLIFVVTTAGMACIGVIVMEGVVIALGGIALLCVLCGLGALSLGVSGVLSVSYIALSTLVNYWCSSRDQLRKPDVNASLPLKKPSLDVFANIGKNA